MYGHFVSLLFMIVPKMIVVEWTGFDVTGATPARSPGAGAWADMMDAT